MTRPSFSAKTPMESRDRRDKPRRRRRSATVLESVDELIARPGRDPTAIEPPPIRPSPERPVAAAGEASTFRPSLRPPMAILCAYDDGQDTGETVRIRVPSFVIGRTAGDLVIPHDGGMSSRHAEIGAGSSMADIAGRSATSAAPTARSSGRRAPRSMMARRCSSGHALSLRATEGSIDSPAGRDRFAGRSVVVLDHRARDLDRPRPSPVLDRPRPPMRQPPACRDPGPAARAVDDRERRLRRRPLAEDPGGRPRPGRPVSVRRTAVLDPGPVIGRDDAESVDTPCLPGSSAAIPIATWWLTSRRSRAGIAD